MKFAPEFMYLFKLPAECDYDKLSLWFKITSFGRLAGSNIGRQFVKVANSDSRTGAVSSVGRATDF